MCAAPAFGIDSWQLLAQTICAGDKVPAASAVQASYFQFRRKDGFECAQRVLASLLADATGSAAEKELNLSRVLWGMFALAVDEPERDADFRRLTTSIRLSDGHPLRAEARLAQLRLSVIRGRPISEVSEQLQPLLADLGLLENRLALAKLYNSASLPLRESIRWLYGTYGRIRSGQTATPAPLELRLRNIAGWGQEAAWIGASSPEILQFMVADAWKSGRRLIAPGELPQSTSTNSLPEISGRLEYSLCASGNCQNQTLDVTTVSDQRIEKKETLDKTDALAIIHYGIGSTPIAQSTCPLSGPACTTPSVEEAGRHYWVTVNSVVVGGAAWKDSFYKQLKGTDNRTSSVDYKFAAQVPIPACTDPVQCATKVIVSVKLIGAGTEDAKRSLTLTRPDGSSTALPDNDIVTLDRSSGKHAIQFELSRSRTESGASSTPWNTSTIAVSVSSGAKVSPAFVAAAKASLAKAPVPLVDYLPLLLMGRALTLRAEAINQAPAYMGLGEALSQYTDSNLATRWDRVYVPLYFLHVLLTNVGPELLPEERRGMNVATKILSNVATKNFVQHVDQQITFLTQLKPALSVALLDSAINAIQKEQPLDAKITPFIQTVLSIPTSGLAPSDTSIAQAKALIQSAREKDNLLDAVLLLYQARERLQQADERVSLQLELLSIEKAGLSAP